MQVAAFREKLAANDADFPAAFTQTLWDLINRMLPRKKQSESFRKQQKAALPIVTDHTHKVRPPCFICLPRASLNAIGLQAASQFFGLALKD